MTKETIMTRGNPAKLMLTFAVPVIFTNLGQQLYQIADAAIVGHGVGVNALAAVGCTDWTYWLILWSVVAMAQGFATYVSRFYGKQDQEKTNKAITMSTYLSILIATALTVIGLLMARPLLIFLETPANILDDAVLYLSTMICGTVIVTLYNFAASVLRAFGNSKSPLIAMIIAAALNIALDLLFVLVFHMGVFGAALASVISQGVSLVFCVIKILKIPYVKLDKKAWALDKDLFFEILAFGLPLAIQYIIIHVGGIIVQSTINVQGSDFIAGYTAMNKLYGLLECSAIALGTSYTTFASQNFGAGEKLRVRKGVNTAIFLALGGAAVVMAITLPLRNFLPQLFIDQSEPGAVEACRVATRYLTMMMLGLPILYMVYVHRNNLQALGNSSWSLISGIGEAAVRVVIAKAIYPFVGVESLFYIEPLAWLAAWLFVFVPYYHYQKKLL